MGGYVNGWNLRTMYSYDLGIMKAIAPSLIHLNYVKKRNNLNPLDCDDKSDKLYQGIAQSQDEQNSRIPPAFCDYDLCVDLGLGDFPQSG